VNVNNREQPATGVGTKGVQRAMAVEVPLDPANPDGEKTELLVLGESQIETWEANPRWRGHTVTDSLDLVSNERGHAYCHHLLDKNDYFEAKGLGTKLYKHALHPNNGNVLVIKPNTTLLHNLPAGAQVKQDLGSGKFATGTLMLATTPSSARARPRRPGRLPQSCSSCRAALSRTRASESNRRTTFSKTARRL
jgi:hypothetical protein